MVLSIVEIGVYGVIGYGTLLFVISMVARKDMPEVPIQAGLRAALCIPGLVCLAFLAFTVAGYDGTTDEDRRFFTVFKYGPNEDEVFSIFYDKIPIELYTEVSTYYSQGYQPVAPGDPIAATRIGDFGTTITRQEIEVDEPIMWILGHVTFIGAIFAWVIYQFAIMFQMAFARKPGT